MKIFPQDALFEEFRRRRHQLAWLSHTGSDVIVTVNIMFQVILQKFHPSNLKSFNLAVGTVITYLEPGLLQQKVDIQTRITVMFAGSSFANNDDYSTQIGFVIFLVDRANRAKWLTFSSHKFNRVVRLVLGGKAHAMADVFDDSFLLKYDLEWMLDRKIPLCLLIYLQNLFNVVVKSTRTT